MSWAVELVNRDAKTADAEADALAAEHGLINLGQVGFGPAHTIR